MDQVNGFALAHRTEGPVGVLLVIFSCTKIQRWLTGLVLVSSTGRLHLLSSCLCVNCYCPCGCFSTNRNGRVGVFFPSEFRAFLAPVRGISTSTNDWRYEMDRWKEQSGKDNNNWVRGKRNTTTQKTNTTDRIESAKKKIFCLRKERDFKGLREWTQKWDGAFVFSFPNVSNDWYYHGGE